MESAESYKDKLWAAFTAKYGDVDVKVLALIEADRAEVRKECANRAVAWQENTCNIVPELCGVCSYCDTLRVTIEGGGK